MLNFIHHKVTHELLIYMDCVNTGAMYMYSFVPLIQGGGMKMFFLITYKQSLFSFKYYQILSHVTLAELENRPPNSGV